MKRRIWPWVVLAILLLLLAFAFLLLLAPATTPSGKGVAYRDRDRWLILATGEVGWLLLILAVRARLVRLGAGLIARAGRFLGVLVLAGGLAVAAVGGWLTSSFLSSEIHGTTSPGHHHWDD